jgi:hypothetical protein
VLSNLKFGVRYSLLFKVKYNGSEYGMLGPQTGLLLSRDNFEEVIESLYNDLDSLIKNFMDEYDTECIELIQLLYIVISSDNPKLKLLNINKVSLNRGFVKIKESKDDFNSKLLPLSVNTNYFGKLLVGDTANTYLEKINTQRELISKDRLDINQIDCMYLYLDKFIIVTIKISDTSFIRFIYGAITGVLLKKVEDTVVNINTFIRKVGNVSLTISKDRVTFVEAKKDLSIIKQDNEYVKEMANPFIGSFDLEAFEDLDGYAKVYAVGFIVIGKEPETFYLGKDQSSEDLVLYCLNLMMDKYDGYLFYTHNFGKYDSIFVSKILKEANKKKSFVNYKLKFISKDNKMLKLEIIRFTKTGFKKITIVDSYNLLNTGLFILSQSFDIDVTKGYFPHSFIKRNTLNYIGNTPSIEY